MSQYLLDEDWQVARHRLSVKERLQDPATIAHLEAAGVTAGWHCLEIGGGGGSIAAWLCRRVGPGGRVVATDTDVRLLKVLEYGNLEVVQHDVSSGALERRAFDLVHARDVLAHIPEREAALAKMADAVRLGGWILVEEPDVSTESADPLSPEPMKQLYLRVVSAIHAFLCEGGVDPFFGSRLYGMLRALGFDSLSSEGRVHTFRGGPAGAEAPHMMAFEQLRQAVVLKGAVTDEEYQRFLDLSLNPAFAWREALTVSARGCRPKRSRV